MIAEIARWWHGRLTASEFVAQDGDIEAVVLEFGCSRDEAIRGICVAEQRYWSND